MFKLYSSILRRKIIFGSTVGVAVFFMSIGVIYWGAFNTAMEETNNMEFCISCHEMENTVYQEYKETIHYKNRSGVRATCPDCHVPKEWEHKVVSKINASQEIFHKLIGSISTKEKFEDKRQTLATHVWDSMSKTNSRECRNCHNFDAMDNSAQTSRSALVHHHAQVRDKTCIDCHKGIAHNLPAGVIAYRGGSDEDHAYYAEQKLECYQCHVEMPKKEEVDWGF